MKTYILLLVGFAIAFSTYGQRDLKLPFKSVAQYDNTQQNTLYLKTHFASPSIINKRDIRELKDKRIYHIDLIYTKFREAEDFDQLELNEKRIAYLKSIIPQIDEDQPNWTVYEQTGAVERIVAKDYYHGFVIHYGDDIAYPEQKNHFDKVDVPFGKVGIDNQKGGIGKYYTGSRVVMQKDAVYHQNGDLVQGFYELHYREFRNPAEIAVSGIPMFYGEDGKSEIFNSAGMYEIRAYQNGEELILRKTAYVNFMSLGTLPDLGFYAMSDTTGEWIQEGVIVPSNNFPQNNGSTLTYYNVIPGLVGGAVKFQPYTPEDEIDQGAYQGQTRIKITKGKDKDQILFTLGEDEMMTFRRGLQDNRSGIQEMIEVLDTIGTVKEVLVYAKDSAAFIGFMVGRPFKDLVRSMEESRDPNSPDFIVYKTKDYGMRMDSLLIVETVAQPPKAAGLIYGLRSENFGIFNCDQTRRLMNPVALQPTYFDKETNQKLENLYQTCVIDMTINASLSYAPNHIYCDPRGNTKLVIFANDNQIYLFDKKDLAAVDLQRGNVDMKVTNITEKVNSPYDLKKILGV